MILGEERKEREGGNDEDGLRPRTGFPLSHCLLEEGGQREASH
jgi:hypothetical protein